jgi:hypothetical protein
VTVITTVCASAAGQNVMRVKVQIADESKIGCHGATLANAAVDEHSFERVT